MQNASFDSINLEDYTLDIREVLEDYAIYKGIEKYIEIVLIPSQILGKRIIQFMRGQ